MKIERSDNEILIRIPANTDLPGLQRLLDYIRFRELTSGSKATENQINQLASESKAKYWKKNKDRFLK